MASVPVLAVPARDMRLGFVLPWAVPVQLVVVAEAAAEAAEAVAPGLAARWQP